MRAREELELKESEWRNEREAIPKGVLCLMETATYIAITPPRSVSIKPMQIKSGTLIC